MKHLKIIGLAAVAAMALTACGASTASATTLEVNGVTQNSAVTLTASLEPGTSMVTRTTGGLFANTCLSSHLHGSTISPFSAHSIGGPLTTLSFSNCSEGPITVVQAGSLDITHISGSTDGTVTSTGAEWKLPSPFGTLTCKTGAGTDIGRLTGATSVSNPSQHATIHLNAVVNCGIIPSTLWQGSLIITSPTDLGVEA